MAGSGVLQNLGAFLGKTGSPATYNESTLSMDPGAVGKYFVSDSFHPYAVIGTTAVIGPHIYQLVQLDSGSGVTFGALLVWKDYLSFTVTTVGSTTKRNDVAGALVTGTISAAGTVANGATAGNYIFMLVAGLAPLLFEAGQTPAAGDAVIGGATTAGRFGITAQGTAPLASQLGVVIGAKLAAFGGITPTTDYCHANLYPRVFSF